MLLTYLPGIKRQKKDTVVPFKKQKTRTGEVPQQLKVLASLSLMP